MTKSHYTRLNEIGASVERCVACPRLVKWRTDVSVTKRRPNVDESYWARPLPGFGDPLAQLCIVGLAPAAHGGNRTGRMFTGDRSGDFLFAALHRAGYANQATSRQRDDGLQLKGAFVTAAVRCAPPENRPTPIERDTCAPYLAAELDALEAVTVVLCLGAFAFDALGRQPRITLPKSIDQPGGLRPRFSHRAEYRCADGLVVLCSYHPSQRNVFTGLLNQDMFDAILQRCRQLGA